MPLISDATKRAPEIAMEDRCSVIRVTRAVDPTTGGWTDSEAVYASSIPCRVDKSGLTSRERAIAERLGSVQTFNLMLSMYPPRWPGGIVSTRAADRFVVTGQAAGTYEAQEDGGPTTTEVVREIVCTRVS